VGAKGKGLKAREKERKKETSMVAEIKGLMRERRRSLVEGQRGETIIDKYGRQ